ncbi:MAG TPA: CBS and ACT domain-containing protein [Candidatus Binatia bacterium]|nr:CBS and ACT domain-containing protein [Candidatus Binatia bacterium]
MLVGNRMTKNPVTIGADELLSEARDKMAAGGFRRLPVMSQGKLVGIITDRDLRAHGGFLERTKVNGIIGDRLITVRSSATLEEAAQRLLGQKIGGLPVVEDGRLVGIITTSDILKAFLDVMGASQPASTRIDFILEGEEHGLFEASRIVSREGGDILGVGTYRERLGESPVCYLRLLGRDPERIAKALRAGGFDVLGVHELAQ